MRGAPRTRRRPSPPSRSATGERADHFELARLLETKVRGDRLAIPEERAPLHRESELPEDLAQRRALRDLEGLGLSAWPPRGEDDPYREFLAHAFVPCGVVQVSGGRGLVRGGRGVAGRTASGEADLAWGSRLPSAEGEI